MTTGQLQVVGLIISFFAVFLIPTMIMLYRGIVKWTRTEDKLDHLIEDVEKLVRDKDATHSAMIQQMTDDRKATDTRLRWLEENLWRRATRNPRNV